MKHSRAPHSSTQMLKAQYRECSCVNKTEDLHFYIIIVAN